jgi:hypothetical protein
VRRAAYRTSSGQGTIVDFTVRIAIASAIAHGGCRPRAAGPIMLHALEGLKAPEITARMDLCR